MITAKQETMVGGMVELMMMMMMGGVRKEGEQEASGKGNAFYYCACYF